MAYETIIYSKEGSFFSPEKNIGIIKLNRPTAYNAVNEQLITELKAALEEIEKDDEVKVAVITAEGKKVFCTGADLKLASELDESSALPLIQQGQEIFNYVETFPKPTIAAINGLALGGGLELALACDIRIASEEAKVGCPESTIGLTPAWGGLQRLPRVVGLGRAKELVFTGAMITAKEAAEMGLINKVVAPDELESTVNWTAAKIAGNAPIALKYAKESLNKVFDVPIEEGLAKDAKLCAKCFGTADIKEGIKAVFEKRKATFKGK
ncbi:MAG: enoyl-CoA hydratase/isomerase family protein [Theionarchaea archaeon]|nr:enoyl-CoA hydratase/isomerase family protein [Theionarchaea archaeon]